MFELSAVRDQEPVEAAAADGAAQRSANAFAFGARNGVRMISTPSPLEDVVEGAAELAVAIVD
jgi:hypothetical protein